MQASVGMTSSCRAPHRGQVSVLARTDSPGEGFSTIAGGLTFRTKVRSQAMSRSGTIGALAKAEKVNVETIRYYQRLNLLDEPPRPSRGVRRYGEAHRERLRFIRAAKAMGFTLSQVAALLELRRRPSCEAGRALAARQLAVIEARIQELAALRHELRGWVARCDANQEERVCPPLETLEVSWASGALAAP
jgi:MerR family mercuric resistance operon transcriptional regulator